MTSLHRTGVDRYIRAIMATSLDRIVFKGQLDPAIEKNITILSMLGYKVDRVDSTWVPPADIIAINPFGDSGREQSGELNTAGDNCTCAGASQIRAARNLTIAFVASIPPIDQVQRLYLLEDGTVEKGVLVEVNGNHAVKTIAFPELQFKYIPWKHVLGWAFDGAKLFEQRSHT